MVQILGRAYHTVCYTEFRYIFRSLPSLLLAYIFVNFQDQSADKSKVATAPPVRVPLRVSRTSRKSGSEPVIETRPRKLETTPVKAQTRTLRDRDKTPVKIPFMACFGDVANLSKTPVKTVNQTPVKSCLSSKTPVKTPAQKRGDQNVSFATEDVIFGNRTPVKNNSKIQTPVKKSFQIQTPVKNSSKIQTPVKSNSKIQTPVKNDQNVQTCQTPVKNIDQPKNQTPTKNNTAQAYQNPVKNISPVKAPTEQRDSTETRSSASSPSKKSKRRRSQRNETCAEKSEVKKTEHESAVFAPEVSTSSGPFERPSRRKSVSIRLGIDDINLAEVVWSPARKSLSGTPNSKAGTPKQSRFASPSDTDSGSRSRLHKKNDRKSSLFAPLTETETDSDSQPLAEKLSKKSKLAGKPYQQTPSDSETGPAKRSLRKLDNRKSLYLATDDTETDSDSQTSTCPLIVTQINIQKESELTHLRDNYRRSLYGIAESEPDVESQPEQVLPVDQHAEASGSRKLTRNRRSLIPESVCNGDSDSHTVSESTTSKLNRSKRTRRYSSLDEVIEVPVEFEEPSPVDPNPQSGSKKKKKKKHKKEVIMVDIEDSVFPEIETETVRESRTLCPEPIRVPIRNTRHSSNIDAFSSPGQPCSNTEPILLPFRSTRLSSNVETFSSLERKRSKFFSEKFELPANATIIPFASSPYRHAGNSSTSKEVDLNTSLGSQITELSSVQKFEQNYASPSLKMLKKGKSPKSRTPKRLRSGSKKKLSPNSKRLRLHIEFAGSPPIITDTSGLSEVRRRQTLTVEEEHEDEQPRFVLLYKVGIQIQILGALKVVSTEYSGDPKSGRVRISNGRPCPVFEWRPDFEWQIRLDHYI